MQDKYVGDVENFGKYGLLNTIFSQFQDNIVLGVNCYKVTRPENNNDGTHIDYLEYDFKDRDSYIKCFPEIKSYFICIGKLYYKVSMDYSSHG